MGRYYYNIISTTVPKQEQVCEYLRRYFPKERGVVFCPMVEAYRRDKNKTLEIKPMFPGYIFIRSDLSAREMHEFINFYRKNILAYIGELGEKERMMLYNLSMSQDTDLRDEFDLVKSDVTYDEGRLLDILLDFDHTGGEIDFNTTMVLFKKNQEAGVSALSQKKTEGDENIPTENELDIKDNNIGVYEDERFIGTEETYTSGLLRMSYGYRESPYVKKWRVMEGPLRALEEHIVDVNTHNKKAYLDIKINNHKVRAGFVVMPKKHWFPEPGKQLDVLEDGTELDIEDLVRSMTGFRRGRR